MNVLSKVHIVFILFSYLFAIDMGQNINGGVKILGQDFRRGPYFIMHAANDLFRVTEWYSIAIACIVQ